MRSPFKKRNRKTRKFGSYWSWLLKGFRRNVAGHWPLFLTALIYPFLSGGLMCLAECEIDHPIRTYWDAVYATWITMATVGYGDMAPVTGAGRLLASIDSLAGLVLVGMVVWFFTAALGRPPDSRGGAGFDDNG